ncbi:FtsX-like permease family protein [Actinoplanes sp. NPDC048796]|uniref:FtsX-like permease family protein n=1 Tax=Actinoplanes sp. NPDC048796 TaxID=3155640 RepID=UPI0033E7A229
MISLVLAMVWNRRGQALVVALLALFGVAAAVAAPAYLRAADRAVAAGQVATALPTERAIEVSTQMVDHREDAPGSTPSDVDLTRTGAALTGLSGFTYVYSAEYPTVGIEPDTRDRTRFVFRQNVCGHLTMTAGRCAIASGDVVLGAETGRRMGLEPGDSVTLSFAVRPDPREPDYVPAGKPKQFLVAGLYRATDPGDVFWGTQNYFGPDSGDRPGEPAFVTSASLRTMDHGAVRTTLDGYAGPGALDVDRLPALQAGLDQLRTDVGGLGAGVELRSGLPDLLTRVDEGRRAAHRIVPVLAVALVLLACLTIFLAVGYGTEGRRPELAVVALRGARWGQRWWLATGENIVAIVAGAILGCLAGQLLVTLFAAWRFPGVGADPGLDSLRWAPVAAGAAVLTALLAERRQIATPVAELLRRAPAVRGSARAVAVEAVVVLLAAVATVQLSADLIGVGTFAVALIVIAAALVIARLLLPWATVLARRALRDGRLGAALAGFQLSRRPGAARLFALLTAAVAVVGYAGAAVDVAARGRALESEVGTGATRVLTLAATGRQNLLHAVRAVDPDGAYAMAAVRLTTDPGRPALLAVDTTRLGRVALGPALDADALRPSAPRPVELKSSAVGFDITAAGFAPNKTVDLTAVLSPREGGPDEVVPYGVINNGRQTYSQSVPACADGCTLNSLRLTGGQGTLDVAGKLTVHSLSSAGWRASEGGSAATSADGLKIDVTSLNDLPNGLVVQPADAPWPLPVATAGVTAVRSVGGLDAREIPVTVAVTADAIPGAGAPAVLIDLDYADRLAADGAPTSGAQVWLNARAPADVVARLQAQGLSVIDDVRAAQIRARLDNQGPAIALWFYVIVAVLATALAAGALILSASVDRARRVEDLSALRAQGLNRRALRQATLWTYPALVAIAVLAGMAVAALGWWLTGWALPLAGLTRPEVPLPTWPNPLVFTATGLVAAAILAAVALAAGRRTLREIR